MEMSISCNIKKIQNYLPAFTIGITRSIQFLAESAINHTTTQMVENPQFIVIDTSTKYFGIRVHQYG